MWDCDPSCCPTCHWPAVTGPPPRVPDGVSLVPSYWDSSELSIVHFQLQFRSLVTLSWLTTIVVTKATTLAATLLLLSTGLPWIRVFKVRVTIFALKHIMLSTIACGQRVQLVFLMMSGLQMPLVTKFLNTLQPQLSASLGTPGTTWCCYIFLGINYLHHTVCPIPWLKEKREVKGRKEGMDL